MEIKKVILLFLGLWPLVMQAEDVSATNRNYFKLCILNEKNEVLLVEHNNNWELIGGEYNTADTLRGYVKTLAMTSNVEVTDIRLRGLFSVYFNSMAKPFVYHYYSARYQSGNIKIPDGCTGAKWVDVVEARQIIAYEEMLWMYEYIRESDHLRGGSYRILKDTVAGTRKVEVIDAFHDLN